MSDVNDCFTKTVGHRFSRERWTLDQLMTFGGAKWLPGTTPNITFDPNVNKQYRIMASHSHDGTLHFTKQLATELLLRMVRMTTYYKPMGEPPAGHEVHYTVGWTRIARVFGKVDLPCGRYPGQRESIVIPVRCEYRKAE